MSTDLVIGGALIAGGLILAAIGIFYLVARHAIGQWFDRGDE